MRNISSTFNDNDQVYLLQVRGNTGTDTVSDNEIVSSAPQVATHRISGFRIGTLPTTRENAYNLRITNNTIRGCYYGVISNAEGAGKGPVVLVNTRIDDCAAGIASSSDGCVFHGHWLGDNCQIRTDLVPTFGNWEEGDTVRTALSLFVCDGEGADSGASWAQAWTGA